MAPPAPYRRLHLLWISAALFRLISAAANSTCYHHNGTPIFDTKGPISPCLPDAAHSMCCRRTTSDVCRSDGLCESGADGNTWRLLCTDSTWQAPECKKLCLGYSTELPDGSVHVTPCPDGSYCCGAGTPANNCCVQGNGVFLDENGSTTVPQRSSTSSRSSGASTATSTTIPSTAAPTSETVTGPSAVTTNPTEESNNNTGAIAGAVVGRFVAAALIILAGIYFLRRRKGKKTGEKEPRIPDASNSQQTHPQQVVGANTLFEPSQVQPELPARVEYEMPSAGLRTNEYHVHESQ